MVLSHAEKDNVDHVNGWKQIYYSNTVEETDPEWSFGSVRQSETLWGPHGYHRYPAKFIPQLVRRIIDEYSEPGNLIGDPFLGSATTGIEALRAGRQFWGIDANPVALLISSAKCIPIEPQLVVGYWGQFQKNIETVPHVGRRKLNENELRAIHDTKIAQATGEVRLRYWFPREYFEALEILLDKVLEIQDQRLRIFFLCAFSNTLRRCSIWLSGSTKPQKDLTKNLNDPRESFVQQVKSMIKGNRRYWDDLVKGEVDVGAIASKCLLALGDAQRMPLRTGALDLLVTSPPYATCYEYSQLHQLTQLWLDRKRISYVDEWRSVCIGSRTFSNGPVENTDMPPPTGSQVADHALSELQELSKGKAGRTALREARALRRYFLDMYAVMVESARVVCPGKYFVLVIGDSRRRQIDIPTAASLCEMATQVGFTLEQRIIREVAGRILVTYRDKETGRFTSAKNSSRQAYPKEDVLIFKRDSSG